MSSYQLKRNSKLVAATESAYRRRWGWWLCDDQWNCITEVSTMIEVSRSSLEAGNGKRGGNWKCDGRRGTGDREMAIRILRWRWKFTEITRESRSHVPCARIYVLRILQPKTTIKNLEITWSASGFKNTRYFCLVKLLKLVSETVFEKLWLTIRSSRNLFVRYKIKVIQFLNNAKLL